MCLLGGTQRPPRGLGCRNSWSERGPVVADLPFHEHQFMPLSLGHQAFSDNQRCCLVLSEYLNPGAAPLQPLPFNSAMCGTLFAHFNSCHEREQLLPPEVKSGVLQYRSTPSVPSSVYKRFKISQRKHWECESLESLNREAWFYLNSLPSKWWNHLENKFLIKI